MEYQIENSSIVFRNIPQPDGYYDVNIPITGDTGGCHHNNLQCHQWGKSWHPDISGFWAYNYIP